MTKWKVEALPIVKFVPLHDATHGIWRSAGDQFIIEDEKMLKVALGDNPQKRVMVKIVETIEDKKEETENGNGKTTKARKSGNKGRKD